MASKHRIYVNVSKAIKEAVAVRMKQLRQRSESDYVLLLLEDDFAKAGINVDDKIPELVHGAATPAHMQGRTGAAKDTKKGAA